MSRRKKKEAEKKRQEYLRERNRKCTGKKSYNSEMEAEGYAKMWSDPRYGKRGDNKPLHAYLCPMCYKWHLTSKVRGITNEHTS